MSAQKIQFDPMALPGCPYCESRVRLRSPSGVEYAGPAPACCLPRSLHQANVLTATLRDQHLEGREDYQRDLAFYMAAIRKFLEGADNPRQTLLDAKQQLAAIKRGAEYPADVTGRILAGFTARAK